MLSIFSEQKFMIYLSQRHSFCLKQGVTCCLKSTLVNLGVTYC